MIDLLIVTPTLNAEKYLINCINSTFNLRKKGAKHIIIDSGSKDSTLEIAKEFGIEVLYCPPGNMYNAINLGINKYDTKWVTYINADDNLFENNIIELFKDGKVKSFDIIYSNIDFINNRGHHLHHFRTSKEIFLKYYFSMGIMPIPQQGTIFKKHVFNSLNGFSVLKKYSSDFDFFMRAYFLNFKFLKTNSGPLASFRLHQEQISQNFHLVMSKEVKDSVNKLDFKPSLLVRIFFLFYLKISNLDSYISRFARFYFLYSKLKFNSTMNIHVKEN